MTIELENGLSYKEIYKLEYLELPVHVMLRFGAGALRPYIFGGPNLGVLLAANLEEEIPLVYACVPEYRQSGTRDIKDAISSTNFSIDLGGGMAFEIASRVQLLIDVRYSLGLSDIAKPPDQNDQSFQPDSWKSRDVKVLVGVLFAL
jgi:opacity protein-like surface antigen